MPVQKIIEMSKMISRSGKAGPKATKADAEAIVKELIGPNDAKFVNDFGYNHWNYLKAVLSKYSESRNIQDEFVIRGYPFNWLMNVDSKCSAVLLRKNYHKGEHRVEPELFLEVGLLPNSSGTRSPGMSVGFHYLDGIDNDDSVFVNEVKRNKSLERMVCNITNQGLVKLNNGHSIAKTGPSLHTSKVKESSGQDCDLSAHWNVNSTLTLSLNEGEIPVELEKLIFKALDDLLPFYRKIISL